MTSFTRKEETKTDTRRKGTRGKRGHRQGQESRACRPEAMECRQLSTYDIRNADIRGKGWETRRREGPRQSGRTTDIRPTGATEGNGQGAEVTEEQGRVTLREGTGSPGPGIPGMETRPPIVSKDASRARDQSSRSRGRPGPGPDSPRGGLSPGARRPPQVGLCSKVRGSTKQEKGAQERGPWGTGAQAGAARCLATAC